MKAARVVLHLPLILAATIVVAFSSDLELFAPLEPELTYGAWVVVGVPVAVLLAIAQVLLWIVWAGRADRRERAR